MDDRIRMHDYSKEQLLLLIEDYVTINFQGMKYQTREAILNMICDAVNYYDIGKDLNWESIIAIREDLEDDLKEYVDEIISLYDNSCGASKDNWIKGYEENILILRSLGADEFYIQQIKNKIIEVKARKVKESKLYYKLAKKIFTKNMVNNDHILDNI